MADADKASILVVDDLPEKLLVYQSILEELGEEVITARSGAEALKQVLRTNFAVILLDVNMPGMDGFETALLIRKRQKSAHTPIIFITAFIDDMRPLQGYAHGAVDYILAPVEPQILRAKVKVFVELFRMHQQVKRRAEERIALAEEQAKRAAAEEANRCSAFLAQASAILGNSLDLGTTLRKLARLAVPFLADLSVVCLTDERSRPCRTTEWAWDAAAEATQPRADQLYLPPNLATAIEHVLASGKLELVGGESLAVSGKEAHHSEFKAESAVVLPLSARDKTLGCLALAFGPSGRRYCPADLSLAEDLACRAGIAIDNAMLIRNIQEADRRKDEFLAMLAHELRNPLAPIRNAVEIMRLAGPGEGGPQQARDVIDRQLRHLTRLVDDLLDVSRITRGKIRLEFELLDVAGAAVSAVEASRPFIDSRRHEFILSLPAEPIQVKADPARLAQVLSNLLNNAAKYTEEGGRIWLTIERDGSAAVMRVRDTGTGISSDMLPRIFEPFTQITQSLDRSQGGLGIGLTLVQRLVEMHEGSVEAFSQGLGQGSEFVVRLPVFADKQPQLAAGNGAAPSQTPGVRSSVLVVDDNVDAAESLAMVLRLHGHEVRTAHDGMAALEAAQAFHPEIVLLDIGLPSMDGYEVARRLRNHPGGDQILLAAITGYCQEEDRSRSREAGFDCHLVKPIDPETLHRFLATQPAGSNDCRGVAS